MWRLSWRDSRQPPGNIVHLLVYPESSDTYFVLVKVLNHQDRQHYQQQQNRIMKLTALISLAFVCHSSAFHFGQMEQRRALSAATTASNTQLQGSISDTTEGDSRRAFFGKTGSAALALASSSGLGLGVLAPEPANAVGGVKKVSEQLRV